MFGPVHAIGHQGDRRRVHRMDRALETPGNALQISKGLPEELLHQLGIAPPVGMTERVAYWRPSPAKKTQARKPKSQRIAHIGRRDAVAHLRVEQAHHVTPGIEAASKLLLTQFPGDLAGRVRGYHLAKLCENAEPVLGWLFRFLFTLPILGGIGATSHIFYQSSGYALWDGCEPCEAPQLLTCGFRKTIWDLQEPSRLIWHPFFRDEAETVGLTMRGRAFSV